MNHHVHHFDMGLWLLFLAYIVSVTGSVVGLACTRQSAAASDKRERLRWLAMASIAIGDGPSGFSFDASLATLLRP